MSLKRQLLKLAVLCLLISLAAWYAFSGPLGTPVPAPPAWPWPLLP